MARDDLLIDLAILAALGLGGYYAYQAGIFCPAFGPKCPPPLPIPTPGSGGDIAGGGVGGGGTGGGVDFGCDNKSLLAAADAWVAGSITDAEWNELVKRCGRSEVGILPTGGQGAAVGGGGGGGAGVGVPTGDLPAPMVPVKSLGTTRLFYSWNEVRFVDPSGTQVGRPPNIELAFGGQGSVPRDVTQPIIIGRGSRQIEQWADGIVLEFAFGGLWGAPIKGGVVLKKGFGRGAGAPGLVEFSLPIFQVKDPYGRVWSQQRTTMVQPSGATSGPKALKFTGCAPLFFGDCISPLCTFSWHTVPGRWEFQLVICYGVGTGQASGPLAGLSPQDPQANVCSEYRGYFTWPGELRPTGEWILGQLGAAQMWFYRDRQSGLPMSLSRGLDLQHSTVRMYSPGKKQAWQVCDEAYDETVEFNLEKWSPAWRAACASVSPSGASTPESAQARLRATAEGLRILGFSEQTVDKWLRYAQCQLGRGLWVG